MRNRSVLISGIGIAGPTLAYWLSRYGFEPVLVERAPALRTGGYVIDFWGIGYDIAQKMGLLPAIEHVGYHVKEVRLVDSEGRHDGGFGTEVFGELTNGRFITVARSDLARLLFESASGSVTSDAPPCETIFGNSVTELRDDGDGVDVSFEHGADRRFDLVIGADGLHSKVRSITFGREARFEKRLGYTVAAFETDGYRPRDEDVYIMYGVPKRQVARFALHGGRTMFLFIIARDFEGDDFPMNMAAQKALLRREYANDGWELSGILFALDLSNDLYFDRVSQIRLPEWSQGRIALIGDAAFCVSFLAGQGSALAMTAAYVLAGELAKADGDYTVAFSRYEVMLRSFIEGKQHMAERMGPSFAPSTSLGLKFRSLITSAFHLPLVAKLAIGRDLADQLELPDYSA